ncbi:hypothetical protein K470DRAFT_271277 [Piedraia hortae CBS 480.64]|uniref:Reverse transcriptase RNase H-like domain-containing protein n=1 Tax=Piedraia hortae CBS 480.64 TaxID=1314780 RepID=A0A6A7BWX0_9PEZI|nr:hypothetical protein K470DRAFT_271277 [Piedraia hortae CBS 480.64]
MAFQDSRPIAVLSKGLSAAERNYNTSERELLAWMPRASPVSQIARQGYQTIEATFAELGKPFAP